MANYPNSLDNFANPSSGDSLSSPSHALQHADANDAIEALEAKVGIGNSPAGSATAGQVLVAGTGGSTSWTTVGASAINTTGGSAGQYLTAGTAGIANWTDSPTFGFRNKIINGGFDIWQRGTSFNTNGVYTTDRWVMGFGGTGTAMTTSQVALTAGNPIPNYEPQYALRCAVTGGSGTSSLAVIAQKIEDVRTFAGQTVTLSFWAKASSGTPGLGFDFYQEFGSGGSATVGGIGATKWTLSTTWTRYSTTVNISSISGKTIGAGSSLAARFWFSSGSDYNTLNNSLGIQSPTIDIWGVQVEPGSFATPFEQRPIGTELALCQRYYVSYNAIGAGNGYTSFGNGQATSTTVAVIFAQFPVEMRVAPVISYSAIGDIGAGNSAGQWIASSSAPTLYAANTKRTQVSVTVASGLTAGNASIGYILEGATSKFIAFSAEL